MIKEKLDQLIRESILNRDTIRTKVLRSIKTKFMEWETAKNAKPLDEQIVIRKMISDRENSVSIYRKNNREDLALNESKEIEVLLEFKEEDISEEDIRNMILSGKVKGIGTLGDMMKYVKTNLPSVDMKIASQIVKELLQ